MRSIVKNNLVEVIMMLFVTLFLYTGISKLLRDPSGAKLERSCGFKLRFCRICASWNHFTKTA